MRYSLDDQYNIVTNNGCSTANYKLRNFAAIDYFQFEFSEVQYHSCWKLIQHSQSSSPFIPQSTNISRLENIIWRKWAKARFNLDECSPESVNWYKDCDITWLYGPLADSDTSEANSSFDLHTKAKRNDSFCSLTSSSTLNSTDSFDCQNDNDEGCLSDNAIYMDDEYEALAIRSILKNRLPEGPLQFEEFRNINIHKGDQTQSGRSMAKSVSFAEMVQIRQFY